MAHVAWKDDITLSDAEWMQKMLGLQGSTIAFEYIEGIYEGNDDPCNPDDQFPDI